MNPSTTRQEDRRADADERMYEAVKHLAAIATAAAAQKEHESRMLAVTAESAKVARKLLEADLRRARLFGWLAAIVGATGTALAIAAALYVQHTARLTQTQYQRLLASRNQLSSALKEPFPSNAPPVRQQSREPARDRTRRGSLTSAADRNIPRPVTPPTLDAPQPVGAFPPQTNRSSSRPAVSIRSTASIRPAVSTPSGAVANMALSVSAASIARGSASSILPLGRTNAPPFDYEVYLNATGRCTAQ